MNAFAFIISWNQTKYNIFRVFFFMYVKFSCLPEQIAEKRSDLRELLSEVIVKIIQMTPELKVSSDLSVINYLWFMIWN